MSLPDDIKQKAIELGFDLVGITDASPIDAEQSDHLADWLSSGYAGQMTYMNRNFEKRINPARLLDNAQSVICVGLNYTPPKPMPNAQPVPSPAGRVATYAQYEDYHSFMKKQLRKLTDFIASIADAGFKICVDSVPLAERSLATRAGLGFIGKNHMLINPALGCQILLGEIITDLKLQPDKPIRDDCSNCDKCVAACPTGALRPDGCFDANKCISYLTIEYKSQISSELAKKIGDRLFGCDECTLACPYQKDAPKCRNKQFKFYDNRTKINLQRILNLSQPDFENEFTDSPINRLGLQLLKRNSEVCLDNTARSDLLSRGNLNRK